MSVDHKVQIFFDIGGLMMLTLVPLKKSNLIIVQMMTGIHEKKEVNDSSAISAQDFFVNAPGVDLFGHDGGGRSRPFKKPRAAPVLPSSSFYFFLERENFNVLCIYCWERYII